MSQDIYKIVITGGPCGGKTSGLSRLQEALTQRGYKVIVVPETATEVICAGIVPNGSGLSNADFQLAILKDQIQKEQIFYEVATKLNEKVVILCDRGALDAKAYCSRYVFSELLKSISTNEVALRDSYDAVFHMKTSADGAEEYYTLSNNTARTETPEQARALDLKTINAWTGHPHFRIIDNSTDFNTKLNRLIGEIFRFLGEPVPIQIERKFLVKIPDLNLLISQYNSEKVDIIQTYLKPDTSGEERRIRQRGNDGDYVHFLTTKKSLSNLSRIETEKRVKLKEYLTLMMSADTELRQIRKERYCFVYNNLYFELDVFPFWDDRAILEIEMTEENQEITLPEYIDVIKEVTDNSEYRNYEIAKSIPRERI